MATTKRDVSNAYCRMVKAAMRAGIDVVGWSLRQGNVANGVSWALIDVGPDPSPTLPRFGYIGKTAREAHQWLDGATAAYNTVATKAPTDADTTDAHTTDAVSPVTESLTWF